MAKVQVQVDFVRNKRGGQSLVLVGYKYILREKSLAIYFEDSQFRKNRSFNLKVSNIYVDKRSRVR